MKTTIEELNRLTLAQAGAETALSSALTDLRDELDKVQRTYLAKIKRLAATYAASESELHAAISAGRDLFNERKTMILNGIKVGFRAKKGSLVFDDAAATVKLIEKKFPDQADALIETEKTPRVAVIKATLTEDQWKQIGCRIEGAGEDVVISSVDSEVEKTISTMVKKLVASMVDTEEMREAA